MVLMAISCIVVTASSLDTLSLLLFGNAWGLQVSPSLEWVPSCSAAQRAAPGGCGTRTAFGDTGAVGGLIVTGGYLLTVGLTVPFALVEISEAFQLTAYCASLACLLQLIVKFAAIAWFPSLAGGDGAKLPPHPPLHAIGWDLGLVTEVAFWSWCISFAVPMWLDEKDEALHIGRPLWGAFSHRAALDLALGVTGAAAFPRMGPTRLNVLDAVAVHPACGVVRAAPRARNATDRHGWLTYSWLPCRQVTKASGVCFVIASLLPNIVDYSMARPAPRAHATALR